MKIITRLFDALIHRRIKKSTRPLGWSSPKAIACWTCEISHTLPADLRQALASAEGFFARHEEHQVNWHEAPGLAGLWTPNADIKTAYGNSFAYAITLSSLATSSAWLVGRESTAINNTANLYTDYFVGGRITNGTTPTVDTVIEVSLYGNVNDTPTYTDVLTGTDSAKTLTSANVKKSATRLLDRIVVDVTTDRVNWFSSVLIAQHFGGALPKYHGLFVAHSCGAALHATAGNHVINGTGVFQTVI